MPDRVGIPVGFTLQPEAEFLERTADVAARADYLEVAPETLWIFDEQRSMQPNGFFGRMAAMGAAQGKRFVAHGVGWSPGSVCDAPGRRAAWRAAIAATHEVFRFGWYTDHLGATVLDGQELALPLPVPMTLSAAERTRARMLDLQAIVPDVGLENTVGYHLFGDPLDEPAFMAEALRGPGLHLLLDLHNVHTMAQNFGFDPADYIDRLPLHDVIELHVSGGCDSDPAWLPGGEVLRLDSHDAAVPEAVFNLLEQTLPRCPRVRGVTLERMEGTVGPEDVAVLSDELDRLRALCRSAS